MPFLSGLKCFCWEISWQSYESSLVGNCFSLAALKILFVFYLCNFNYDVCWCGPVWIHFFGDSLSFLELFVFLLYQIRKVFSYYFFKYVLNSLFSFFPSNILMMWVLLCFLLSQRSLKLFYFLLFFNYFCSDLVFSSTLSSLSPI